MSRDTLLGEVWGFSGVSGAIVGVFFGYLYRQCFPKDILGAPGLVFGGISKDLWSLEALFVASRNGFGRQFWVSFRVSTAKNEIL